MQIRLNHMPSIIKKRCFMKKWMFLIILPFILTGCNLFRSSHVGPKTIDDAISLWKSKNITRYSIKEAFTCDCAPPTNYRITVANDSVTGVYDYNSNQQLNPDSISDKLYQTVDSMLQWLKEKQSQKPYQLKMFFDINYGFPTQVYYDPNKQKVGDEIVFTFSELQKQ